MKRKNPNLKSPYQTSSFSTSQIIELAKCINDPIYFIKNYIKIKTIKGEEKFILRPYQERMIKAYQENRFSIVLASRQVGKTETSCAYLLWYALFKEKQTILITAHKSDHAMEIISKIQYAYEMLPAWIKPGIREDNWNKHTAAFENDSRIISTTTTATSGRGLTISLLYCDELAFVQSHIATEFWDSIQPTLATGGRCIISSTPNGSTNLFAGLWRAADSGASPYFPIRVRWDEPPDRDENFKREQISIIGARKWKQEYECEFLTADKTLMDQFALTQAENQKKEPKLFVGNNYPLYEYINPNLTYIIAIDPSEGTGNDHSVIELFSFPNLEQVMEIRSDTSLPKDVYKEFKNLCNFLSNKVKKIYFSIENNSVGNAFINLYLSDENRPQEPMFISESNKDKLGFNTNGVNRERTLISFKQMFESGNIKLNSPQIFKELRSFVNKNGKYQADTGSSDDCVMAVTILIRIIAEMADSDGDAYLKIYNTANTDPTAWEVSTDPRNLEDDSPMPILIG